MALNMFDLPGAPKLPEIPGFVLEAFNTLIREDWDGKQATVHFSAVAELIAEGAREQGIPVEPDWSDSRNLAPHYIAKNFRTVGYYEDGKGAQRPDGQRYYVFKK